MVRRSQQWAFAHRLWLSAVAALLLMAGGVTYGLWPGQHAPTFVKGEQFKNSASAKANFTLSMSPASRTVTQGTNATYMVTMSPSNGYKGPITLAASIPAAANVTASFTPATVDYKTQSSTLTISTGNAEPGTWSVSVNGTDGSLTHSANATLRVNPQPTDQKFALDATPPSVQVLPGDVAQYSVSLTRNTGYTNDISLSVTGVPSAATASFNPSSPVSGSSSTLQVTTTASTPAGVYPLQISAAGSGATTQTKSVELVVTDKGKPFSISGSPVGTLVPGPNRLPINLSMSNPNNQNLNITNLTVTVVGTSAGSACAPTNFAVQQFSGAYPLALPKNATKSLSDFTANQSQWPSVRMVETGENQDACKNAQVFLAYTGAGQG